MHKVSRRFDFVKTLLLFVFAFVLTGAARGRLYAADFYWENPAVITDRDSRFPVTLRLPEPSGGTVLFWQEVDASARQLYLSIRVYSSLTNS